MRMRNETSHFARLLSPPAMRFTMGRRQHRLPRFRRRIFQQPSSCHDGGRGHALLPRVVRPPARPRGEAAPRGAQGRGVASTRALRRRSRSRSQSLTDARCAFVNRSNNMLYPSQDREIRRLMFRCRNCGQSEEVEENCIYANELVKDTRCVWARRRRLLQALC